VKTLSASLSSLCEESELVATGGLEPPTPAL
jgi:hypothetical protein